MDPPDPCAVTTLRDFIAYLEELSRHFARERETGEWQHWEIGDYLGAIAAWLRATPTLEGERKKRLDEIAQERPTWRGVATLFEAGRIYE